MHHFILKQQMAISFFLVDNITNTNTNMNDGFVQTPNGKFIIKSTFKKKNFSKIKNIPAKLP